MIKIEKVNKFYGKKHVLKDVDLVIKDNSSVAFIGSNGSGKTTLVEIIAELLKPTSGTVKYIDDATNNVIKKRVGMQFQDGSWPPGTKILDLVKFYKNKAFLKTDEFNDLVASFSLEKFINKTIDSLSGGERQRANCFLSIINKPEVLILDELITGLDLEMQIKLVNYFKNYKNKNNLSLLVVSHIPEEVEELCDRVIILKDGVVFEDKKMSQILKEHGSLRKRLIKYYNIEIINK
ncbi:ATP-binding cassette domain-containing protein [Spiroplasma turonicum]|uniref:ABC-type transport system ATP-binding protein n=1 Tax=Spiroplasma turonicum TaxID=216946 RepID=A0A0K1P6L6_9MOLU|nr:ABC transporter ATP-binding protein [Spiroplasma turonicum]AKU79925.1 ABC-type transport system ATP-binding protein [Spiroplasma turonicum]ALX70939.1 ABC transporter ATP-binding protein [Spiroplasma turonicum]